MGLIVSPGGANTSASPDEQVLGQKKAVCPSCDGDLFEVFQARRLFVVTGIENNRMDLKAQDHGWFFRCLGCMKSYKDMEDFRRMIDAQSKSSPDEKKTENVETGKV